MSVTIPMWILYFVGAIASIVMLALAFFGVCFLILFWGWSGPFGK